MVPPNGAAGSDARPRFSPTIPDSTFSDTVIEDALPALHLHVHQFRMPQPPAAVPDAIEEHSRISLAIAAADAMRRQAMNSQRRFSQRDALFFV